MWKFKSCPRCGGDIFMDRDEHGLWYEQCLQCGYSHELREVTELHEPINVREKEPVVTGNREPAKYPNSRSS